jgi:hypothetical protein
VTASDAATFAPATCSAASLAAGEPLAATATEAARWLLVEVRGSWGRDAVADSGLPDPVQDALAAFPGKVLLIRRPDRRDGVTVIHARADEGGGAAAHLELGSLAELPGLDLELDLDEGTPLAHPILLVCAHGRRDACCARLGLPFFDALQPVLPPERLWQSSHLGGHRFAPNVLVLPSGVQLGRIPFERSVEVARLIEAGRIPLDLYRGRTIYSAPVQAAEIALRAATGIDAITDLRLIEHEGDRVTFATTAGERVARVEERSGPMVPPSCGADPEPTSSWFATVLD